MDENKYVKISLGTAICIPIIILLIIALGVVYYFGFIKYDKNEQNTKPSIIENTSIAIDTQTNNETNIEHEVAVYKDFAIVRSEDATIQYLIAKDENNIWHEIKENVSHLIRYI